MGVRMNLVLDGEIPGGNPDPEGKSLLMGSMLGNLDDIAESLGVAPLMAFASADAIAGGDASEGEWFPASRGLATFRALLDHLSPDPSVLECQDPDYPDFEEGVMGELAWWEECLRKADEHEVDFRIDIG